LEDLNDEPKWTYDHDDPDESFVVDCLRRIYMLADAQGNVKQSSDLYASIGEEPPDQVKATLRSHEPVWNIRKDEQGTEYLIRSGVVYSSDPKHRAPYFVAIGRSLADNN